MDDFESYVKYWEGKKIEDHERQLDDLVRRETEISQGESGHGRLSFIAQQINFHRNKLENLRFSGDLY
ncbi:hypothetical protein BB542_22730 [Escherichia coli]|uniref:hypothetical protein n=1 Tax=Enterobacteriaceae TaxID=543 RepID=UPI000B42844E|nr:MULTISPECIES: hypothetical protein [Escherichia]EEZ5735177.1 hypothetical protein [Escherichia coli O6]EHN2281860.1 hypothetical protein [Shigella sonnei]EIH0606018.1 hypothetical protein [Escherichia coli O55]AUJ94915.1 hypothetical protein CR539_05500 [Escherichia coli]EEW0399238.1 hypothetical protein [Escherichia coli]